MKISALLFITFFAINHASKSQCWRQIVTGGNHNLAIKTDGTLWTWGANNFGQLGNNTIVASSSPSKIGIATDWAQVAAGVSGDHSFAIKTDGTLWAWGYNFYGQLGDGTGTDRHVPTQIGSATDWKYIAPGSFFTLALKTDGTLWAWGRNDSGQLGIGSNLAPNDLKLVPTQIGTDTDWVKIAAGDAHCLAIKSNGNLFAWGFNLLGQLGNGLNANRLTPTLIGSDTDWADIVGGDSHSVALKTNGKMYSTGNNLNLQLGQGTSGGGTNTNTFIQIGTDTDWAKLGSGEFHSFAIKTNGTLYGWGFNTTGQLGVGTNGPGSQYNTPTQVGTANDWTYISGGRAHTVGLSRAELYTCGQNLYGQLGNGNIGNAFNVNTPIQISCGGGFATWSGTVDTNWNNSGNWQFGQLPSQFTLVTIKSGAVNYPIISTSATIKSLKLQSGSLLTIQNGVELTVNGQ